MKNNIKKAPVKFCIFINDGYFYIFCTSPAENHLDLKVKFKGFSSLILVGYMLPFKKLADDTLS